MPEDRALVLSGGGARAAYQVGVVKAIAEMLPALRFDIITGVSAGAINTVSLAANAGSLADAAADLEAQWDRLTPDQVYRARPVRLARAAARFLWQGITKRGAGPTAFRGLLDMQPLRGFLEEAVDLRGIAANVAAGRLRAVALSTTSYTTGWTVTFVQGGEQIAMWSRAQRVAIRADITFDHLLASAAIPIVFPAVGLHHEFFGDGSVRQAAPLAPAVHLGATKILAIGMRRRRSPAVPVQIADAEYPSAAEVFGLLLHAVFLDALDTDAERLERINRTIQLLPPGAVHPEGLRRLDLLLLRPSRDLGAMAREYDVRLPPIIATVVRAMGGRRVRAADFLSYLMFDPRYTGELIALGYDDTIRQQGAIERFFRAEGS
jgi:NTE family protein